MGQAANLVLVLLLAGCVALWLRARTGSVAPGGGERFVRGAVEAPDGVRLLVEFTAPGCVPCAQARTVLGAAAAEHGDVVVVTADVGAHHELARRHRVLRAPTTLLVDADDLVLQRISGVPSPSTLATLLSSHG